MRLKTFEFHTITGRGTYIYYTKAKNGKEALKTLITRSLDYKNLISETESNNIVINIKHCKTRDKS
jgi:hypothetical protein